MDEFEIQRMLGAHDARITAVERSMLAVNSSLVRLDARIESGQSTMTTKLERLQSSVDSSTGERAGVQRFVNRAALIIGVLGSVIGILAELYHIGVIH